MLAGFGPAVAAGLDARIRCRPAGEGVVSVLVDGPRIAFRAEPGERFYGFGERSHRCELRGQEVEHYVGEGPYQPEEYDLVRAIVPSWGIRERPDATYFPVPWLVSSRGYGVLVDNPETSRHRLCVDGPDLWSIEVEAPALRLRVFAGPSPAEALGRLSAETGRQPFPAAPWFLGPWFQTGHEDLVPLEREAELVRTLQQAGAPVSAAETHMRRLPAGAHRGRRDAERRRTAQLHSRGLASLTYLNPMVSVEYEEVFSEAASRGLLLRRADGSAYTFQAYVGGREVPITEEAQLDFTNPGAEALFETLIAEAVADGHDGWMEDFGEYTPPDSVSSDGRTGAELHNVYPLLFHSAAARAAARVGGGRPLARFCRSGWTGAAPHVPIVWGGDPTTSWGFDGLRSAVTEGLSMGLSGIGVWGTDIGGFFSLGEHRLTEELLIRWIQLGALVPVMRTKAAGVSIPPAARPQVWDPGILPHWRRWASFHTRLNPYLLAAAREYVETGMPIMRHLVLAYPDDDVAASLEDEYLLGPDLLVAPVLEEGARVRSVYLPAGLWADARRGEVHRGPGWVELPAPLEEAPVLIREGAEIPLLPADVMTLTDHGADSGVVRLADRAGPLEPVSFPGPLPPLT
jgi:alpha-glucosidase (family GH31 glycosyl hydrolase)